MPKNTALRDTRQAPGSEGNAAFPGTAAGIEAGRIGYLTMSGNQSAFQRPPVDPLERSSPPAGWTYGDILQLVLFSIPILALIFVLFVGTLQVLDMLFGWTIDTEHPRVQASLAIVIQFFAWIFIIGFIHNVVTVKYRLPFARSIGWSEYAGSRGSYLAGGFGLALGVAVLSTFLPKVEEPVPLDRLLSDPVGMLLIGLFGVLVAPAAEELLFRGFIYPVVERSSGASVAVFATSLVFSLLHGVQYGWRWQNLILLLVVGVVFGMIRARTGSIIPPTLVHSSYNASLFLMIFAAGADPSGS